MIRRPPRSTQSRSSAASDVYKRQTESWRLDRANAESAAKLVHHKCRKGLALDVLCDDEQRLAELRNLLENRKQILHRRDLLVVDENHAVFENGFHLVRISDEVR